MKNLPQTALITAAQMRQLEQDAMKSGAVTGLELMERAGCGVVEAVFEKWPEFSQTSYRAVVLCGPGNNGGDGFVIARLLKEQGWEVDVFLYGDPEKLPPDARTNYERWRALGDVIARSIDPPPLMDDSLHLPKQFDLLVDALFGTGLTRRFTGLFSMFADQRELLRTHGVKVVAVDVPTGLCSDSGRLLGHVIEADLTVTFHQAKLGHYLAEGPRSCGTLDIRSIGLEPRGDKPTAGKHVRLVANADAAVSAHKGETEHKYAHGHALVLSGPLGRGGAARLAARGALRVGAGLVTVACPDGALSEHASHLNAIMCQAIGDIGSLIELLADPRLNALCAGPGLGTGDEARAQVTACLAAERAIVLDADALTAYSDAPESLFGQLHQRCVLTPHGGEFARLFPDIAAKLAEPPISGPVYSKVDATLEAAERAGCTVLFKGPDTVIASPDRAASIQAAAFGREAPWLATAGAGDVLAGIITGLMARGFEPHTAAATGAWLHVEAARVFGPGLIAEDLPETLPQVFQVLLEKDTD
ncbi:MAG: NAD(P)H-hydrate dehydratase [Rhodobacteraceae bacterium]|nr:NAD(P)H-hydrate dehydratase [Paracoccaceae bacterium]